MRGEEKVRIRASNSLKFFDRTRKEETRRLKQEGEEWRQKFQSVIEEIDSEVKENYGRKDGFYRFLEDFRVPEDVDEMKSHVEVLRQEFSGRAEESGEELSRKFEEFDSLFRDFREFYENHYDLIEKRSRIKSQVDSLEEAKSRIEELEQEKNYIEAQELEDRIEEMEDEGDRDQAQVLRRQKKMKEKKMEDIEEELEEKRDTMERKREKLEELLDDIFPQRIEVYTRRKE
ncbi:MAG: hypothetical protein ABEK01_00400 [Candidatus Nanohaloarchaea archaeon]